MLDFIKEITDREGLIDKMIDADDNFLRIKGHHLPEKDMREFYGLTDEEIVKLKKLIKENKVIKEHNLRRKLERMAEDFQWFLR